MKDWFPRIFVLAALALVLGVPFLLRPTEATRPRPTDASQRLVIFSPHNEQIRHEFAQAFSKHRVALGHQPVEFDWRSAGGTTDLRKQVEAQFDKAARQRNEDSGIGVDLFFGGGDFDHNLLAKGIPIQRDGAEVRLPLTVPARIPAEVMAAAYPQPTIGGVPLYHPEKRWMGVVLSSFGIIYNRDVHRMLSLPEPTTWTDLQDPRYFRWLALADPEHSSSIAVTYNTILRRTGWTEGWRVLRRCFANARYFTSSASKPPVDVSAGEAAAGMCIDFYGRFQAGAIAEAATDANGRDRVGYVDPAFMTAVTPDTISILRGAPHADLANQFIVWLLSSEAQRLWQRKLGTPNGPERFELRRLPVRRDLYNDEEMTHWNDQVRPFDIAREFPEGTPDFFAIVRPLTHSVAIDVHDDLKAAWKAIVDHPEHPRRAEMEALFDAMPEELTLSWPSPDLAEPATTDDATPLWRAILQDAGHPRRREVIAAIKAFTDGMSARYKGYKDREMLLRDRQRWTLWFRDNYRKVVAIAESPR